MINVAITGANGLVGSQIISLLPPDFHFLPVSHKDVDITKKTDVTSYLDELDYDLILHLAGYTNVEGAETEKEQAHLLNVEGTKNLFEASQKKQKPFIYISTDFVFDGTNPPYDEESIPHPLGYYAKTKYDGENIVKDHAMIVRISYPYGNATSPKPDFVTRLKKLLAEGQELTMMTDATITPTFIPDIAESFDHLLRHFSTEVFHIVGSQNISPYQAGKAIAQTFGFSEDLIKPTTYAEYSKGKAPRPQYSSAISKKNTFHHMKTFEEGLRIYRDQSI
jgi:dTDP-4-dehydrorhamnose reductase